VRQTGADSGLIGDEIANERTRRPVRYHNGGGGQGHIGKACPSKGKIRERCRIAVPPWLMKSLMNMRILRFKVDEKMRVPRTSV
jgi:hypothetical protein